MASISTDKKGNRRILWVEGDSRKQVRIGKVPIKTAQEFKTKIEHILAAKIAGFAVDGQTAEWMAKIDATLAQRLAKAGLIPKREAAPEATLGAFLDSFIDGRSDAKPRTIINLKQGATSLVEFLGKDKPLREISEGDADRFRTFLKAKGYASATISRRIKHAKHFLRVAAKRRLIPSSPFADLRSGKQDNTDRAYFVTRNETELLMEACPDAQWRLLIALARYGGLRTPSESLRVRWQDVNWELGRMTVRSPKTEYIEGKGQRIVPLFPELRKYLGEAFDLADEGAEYAITKYRDDSLNLRTGLERIIERAGLKPWPRLWQNMRASRQTELVEQFPLHVVCRWVGNSPKVADKHYLQILDDHYQRASSPEAAQNAAQQATASGCESVHGAQETRAERKIFDTVRVNQYARRDSKESMNPRETCGCCEVAAQNPAQLYPQLPSTDPELDELIEAWSSLSPEARQQVLALVRQSE